MLAKGPCVSHGICTTTLSRPATLRTECMGDSAPLTITWTPRSRNGSGDGNSEFAARTIP